MKKSILSLIAAFVGTAFMQIQAAEILQAPPTRAVGETTIQKGFHLESKETLSRKAVYKLAALDAEMAGVKKENYIELLQDQFFMMHSIKGNSIQEHYVLEFLKAGYYKK